MVRKVLIGAVLLVALAASPAAAEYGTSVTPGQVQAGGVITITGQACVPNVPITITITQVAESGATRAARATGDVIGTITVTPDADGNFSTTFTIPAGTAPGTYEVSSTEACVKGETFEVAPASVAPGGTGTGAGSGSGNLPRTGTDIERLGLIGAGLLVAGGLVLVATRRRRHLVGPAI